MTRRPNVLMICSDQHTPRVLGAYGDRVVATPNLDALAADGTRYDACYCNCPICVPSRASFMTGRYPFKCDVLENAHVLDSRIPTMAHMAVQSGYHTVLAGKMHFRGPDQHHGFLERPLGEFSYHALHEGAAARYEGLDVGRLGNCYLPDPLHQVGPGRNPFVEYDRVVTERFAEWLGQYKAAGPDAPPFFFFAGFLLPHCPFIAPPEVFDFYRDRVRAPGLTADDIAALHPFHHAYRRVIDIDGVPEANLDRAAAAYYGLVDVLDQNVGRLMSTLQNNGFAENTIVVYFSDHGEMLGQHGRWHKESFFEDAARVPLMIRYPDRPSPAVVAEPCSLVDLMPTLCDWIGADPPPGIDGQSLAGESAPSGDRPVKVEVYPLWPGNYEEIKSNRMVRRGPWKLSYYSAFDSFELFNLADDPGETRNLAGDPACAAIRKQLTDALFQDGWTAHTGRDHVRRLNANGFLDVIRSFRAACRNDPLPKNCPD
jgi:choline-sulfatase